MSGSSTFAQNLSQVMNRIEAFFGQVGQSARMVHELRDAIETQFLAYEAHFNFFKPYQNVFDFISKLLRPIVNTLVFPVAILFFMLLAGSSALAASLCLFASVVSLFFSGQVALVNFGYFLGCLGFAIHCVGCVVSATFAMVGDEAMGIVSIFTRFAATMSHGFSVLFDKLFHRETVISSPKNEQPSAMEQIIASAPAKQAKDQPSAPDLIPPSMPGKFPMLNLLMEAAKQTSECPSTGSPIIASTQATIPPALNLLMESAKPESGTSQEDTHAAAATLLPKVK